MSLYDLKEVGVVEEVGELGSLLFTAEEDEFAMPEPGTALLFTQEGAARKHTINDLLCYKGEETICQVMKEILKNNKVYLVVVKMSIVKAEWLMFHPLFRLKEFPTLMSLDGVLRLSGCDVSNQLLVWDFFEEVLSSSSDRPAKAFLRMTSPDYAPDRIFSLEDAGDDWKPSIFPLELVHFWEVQEAARARAEVTAQLAGLQELKTEADTRLLEEKIREELAVLVPVHEAEGLLASWEETKEETIVPLDLDDMLLVKDVLQIERKPRPRSPEYSRQSRKSSRKSKKSSRKSRKSSRKSRRNPSRGKKN